MDHSTQSTHDYVAELAAIMKQLRSPQGCPWDREQTHESILSCCLDETYEFMEAVHEQDDAHIREELGDLLLQIVFHSQLAAERGAFTLNDVAREICEKMWRRHPHVFGDVSVSGADEVVTNWDTIKRGEKGKKKRSSVLDGIPERLPALFRAEKLQRRAARVGFDWDAEAPVLDKVEEEFGEFRQALESGDASHAAEELGDILFSLVNVARHRQICAEDALRQTMHKFERRFRFVEQQFARRKKDMREASLEQLDREWDAAKQREREEQAGSGSHP